jgi:hypothetical protein
MQGEPLATKGVVRGGIPNAPSLLQNNSLGGGLSLGGTPFDSSFDAATEGALLLSDQLTQFNTMSNLGQTMNPPQATGQAAPQAQTTMFDSKDYSFKLDPSVPKPEAPHEPGLTWSTTPVEDFFLGGGLQMSKALFGLAKLALQKVAAVITKDAATDLTEGGVSTGTKLFRVWGGKSPPNGNSWTTVNPAEVGNFRSAAGLGDWNAGRFVSEGVLKDATGVSTRPALSAAGNPGGLPEVVVTNPQTQIELLRVSGANPEY